MFLNIITNLNCIIVGIFDELNSTKTNTHLGFDLFENVVQFFVMLCLLLEVHRKTFHHCLGVWLPWNQTNKILTKVSLPVCYIAQVDYKINIIIVVALFYHCLIMFVCFHCYLCLCLHYCHHCCSYYISSSSSQEEPCFCLLGLKLSPTESNCFSDTIVEVQKIMHKLCVNYTQLHAN